MRFGFVLMTLFFLLTLLASLHAASVCGDNTCEGPFAGGNENSCNCPQDCGLCAPATFEECIAYSCDANSVCQRTTTPNCCGNGICETGETLGACPKDCGEASTELEIISPEKTATFARAEHVPVIVKVSSNKIPIANASVTATGFFGTIQLFNDGKHGDASNSDNVYANNFLVSDKTPQGKQTITLTATYSTAEATLTQDLTINAQLTPAINPPQLVFLGNTLTVDGTLSKGKEPTQARMNLTLFDAQNQLVDSTTAQTDENGFFSYSFHTSLIDPTGKWTLDANGTDINHNAFSFQTTIRVEDPKKERFLGIGYLLDKKNVSKGDSFTIIATISDFGTPIDDAVTELIDPMGKTIPFSFIEKGKYSVVYTIPFEMPVGEQTFKIHARHSTGILVEGFKQVTIDVQSKPFGIELIEPKEKKLSIGDSILFRVHAEYEPGKPILDANAFAIIAGTQVPLPGEGGGFYSGEYRIQEKDAGSAAFEIVVADRFENKASVKGQIEIFGLGLNHYIQSYGALFVLTVFVFCGIFFFINRVLVRKATIQRLEKRKLELIELEKNIQTKYFEQASIEKNEFDKFMEQYEKELKETEKKLAKLQDKKTPEEPKTTEEPT